MNLKTSRFYCGGGEMQFSIFSDAICRAHHLENITVPFGDIRVDVYSIEPARQSRWVLVQQKQGDTIVSKWFLRKGANFMERPNANIPKDVMREAFQKFPHLAAPPKAA